MVYKFHVARCVVKYCKIRAKHGKFKDEFIAEKNNKYMYNRAFFLYYPAADFSQQLQGFPFFECGSSKPKSELLTASSLSTFTC